MIKVIYKEGLINDQAVGLLLAHFPGLIQDNFRYTSDKLIEKYNDELGEEKTLNDFMHFTFLELSTLSSGEQKNKVVNEVVQHLQDMRVDLEEVSPEYDWAILSLTKEARFLTEDTNSLVIDALLSNIKRILDDDLEGFSFQDFKDLMVSGKLSSLRGTPEMNNLWDRLLSQGGF